MSLKGIKFSAIIPVVGTKKVKFKSALAETIILKKYKKAEARNFGAKRAKSNYLIHIDKDNEIKDEILVKAKKLIQKTGAKAIVLEESIPPSKNIWQKARILERKILSSNKILATPQIIEKKLFFEIGGYDSRFNELDDWALWMRLRLIKHKTYTIKNGTTVHEPTNIFDIVKRRFKKGRELKYFKEVYGSIPQTNLNNILKLYLKTPPSIPLLILKFFDIGALFVGSLFPIRPSIDKLYEVRKIARNFNKEQYSTYGRLKNFLEVYFILQALGDSPKSVLDFGTGTGRITKELVKRKFKVTACDISEAMLSEFPKKLPKPILLNSDRLPFKNSFFDCVISIRVIWHIKDIKSRENFFNEAVRVAKKHIIMDFSFFGSQSDHQFNWIEVKDLTKKHGLRIVNFFYLPLGRLLIKFEKK